MEKDKMFEVTQAEEEVICCNCGDLITEGDYEVVDAEMEIVYCWYCFNILKEDIDG